MTDFKDFLLKLNNNLNILQEREAKYGGAAPLDLLNQINDHKEAITLTRQVITGEITEVEWNEATKSLLLALNNGQVINVEADTYIAGDVKGDVVAGNKTVHIHYHGQENEVPTEEKPHQHFEPKLVEIPGGPFTMGSNNYELESPAQSIQLDSFLISKYPITNDDYLAYVKSERAPVPAAGWRLAKVGMEPPDKKRNHPVVGVTWDDAVAYCNWLRKQTGRNYRLPTEAEWEKAARGGTDDRAYPWGFTFDPQNCNYDGAGTTAIDHYSPRGESPYGCADMVGNVWEWTSTKWGRDYSTPDYPYPYQTTDQREDLDPYHPHREYRVIRGGSYLSDSERLRCSARDRQLADERTSYTGFRIVMQGKKS